MATTTRRKAFTWIIGVLGGMVVGTALSYFTSVEPGTVYILFAGITLGMLYDDAERQIEQRGWSLLLVITLIIVVVVMSLIWPLSWLIGARNQMKEKTDAAL